MQTFSVFQSACRRNWASLLLEISERTWIWPNSAILRGRHMSGFLLTVSDFLSSNFGWSNYYTCLFLIIWNSNNNCSHQYCSPAVCLVTAGLYSVSFNSHGTLWGGTVSALISFLKEETEPQRSKISRSQRQWEQSDSGPVFADGLLSSYKLFSLISMPPPFPVWRSLLPGWGAHFHLPVEVRSAPPPLLQVSPAQVSRDCSTHAQEPAGPPGLIVSGPPWCGCAYRRDQSFCLGPQPLRHLGTRSAELRLLPPASDLFPSPRSMLCSPTNLHAWTFSVCSVCCLLFGRTGFPVYPNDHSQLLQNHTYWLPGL